MPHSTAGEFQHITIQKLHPTFGAEVSGVDFSKPVPQEVFLEVQKAIGEYGVLMFRKTGLDDARLVKFAKMWGELDEASPFVPEGEKHRYEFLEIFDVGNVEEDGSVTKVGSKRHHLQLGNYGFHADFSFNPRRAGISFLRAQKLPPRGTGGGTDFADEKTAYDELPADLKQILEENDFLCAHSAVHSRKISAPVDSPWIKDLDPEDHNFGRHSVIQTHEASGRKCLYLANHMHHLEYKTPRSPDFVPTAQQPFERVPEPMSYDIITRLMAHASQDKYVLECEWLNEGDECDLVLWDNTSTMHRAHGGAFVQQEHPRDMRRAIAYDNSKQAYGYNDRESERQHLTYLIGK